MLSLLSFLNRFLNRNTWMTASTTTIIILATPYFLTVSSFCIMIYVWIRCLSSWNCSCLAMLWALLAASISAECSWYTSLFEASDLIAAAESGHISMETDLYSSSVAWKQIWTGSCPGISNMRFVYWKVWMCCPCTVWATICRFLGSIAFIW